MMCELVTIPAGAELLHIPAAAVARLIDRAHLPAAGVNDDGRALLFSLARLRELVPPPERTVTP